MISGLDSLFSVARTSLDIFYDLELWGNDFYSPRSRSVMKSAKNRAAGPMAAGSALKWLLWRGAPRPVPTFT